MRALFAFAIAALLPGCWLMFDDGGSGGECLYAADTRGAPGLAPAPLRNPSTLTCETFGPGCNPECGPCPLATDLAPIPSWGTCGSTCEGLGEAQCATDPSCRVVKDAGCAIGNRVCVTDYMGCFPTDQITDLGASCFTQDAWQCSRSSQCTAFHRNDPCQRDEIECARSFALCMPEGKTPGRCFEPVACDRVPPVCPTNSRPGIASGCYTDACIPVDLCEPVR